MLERLKRVIFKNNVLTVASRDRRDMISQSHPVGLLYDPQLLVEQINVMIEEAEERGRRCVIQFCPICGNEI